MVVKVGVAKLGNIASGVMAELLLDERADREDMMTFMATSGTKLQKEDVDRVVSNLKAWQPDFAIVVSPNGVLEGPVGARDELAAAGIPVIVITDDVTTKKEGWEALKASNYGYIIIFKSHYYRNLPCSTSADRCKYYSACNCKGLTQNPALLGFGCNSYRRRIIWYSRNCCFSSFEELEDI